MTVYGKVQVVPIESTNVDSQKEVPTSTDKASPSVAFDPFAYRSDIDGLRAVCVVAVMIYHIDEDWLPGGFIGVDIFFLISGYVVLGSQKREKQIKALRQHLFAFYARRVKRLSPPLLLVATVTGLLIALFYPPSHANTPGSEYYHSGIFGLIGGANMYFIYILGKQPDAVDAGYFSEVEVAMANAQVHNLQLNPFMHLWSLGVEEQFYFLFPWLVVFVYRALPECYCNSRLVPLTVLTGSCLVSLLLSAWLSFQDELHAFYLMPSRWWQLILGAMLFEAHDHSTRMQTTWRLWFRENRIVICVVEVCSVAMIAIALVFTNPKSGFPVPWSFFAMVGAALFIHVGTCSNQVLHVGCISMQSPVTTWILRQRLPAYIGRISYPLYLWHWPIFVVLKWTIGLSKWEQKLLATGASIAGAMLTYHMLEGIVKQWRPKKNSLILLVFLPVVGAVVLLLFLLGGAWNGKLYMYGDDGVADCEPSGNASFLGFETHGCNCERTSSSLTYPPCPMCLPHSFKEDLLLNWMPSSCNVYGVCKSSELIAHHGASSHWTAYNISMHERANRKPIHTLFLFGDSHAGHLTAGLTAALHGKFNLVLISTFCFFAPPVHIMDTAELSMLRAQPAWQIGNVKTLEDCSYRNFRTWEFLHASLKAGDVVMFSLLETKFNIGSPWARPPQQRNMNLMRASIAAYRKLAQHMATFNASLVLPGDVPFMLCYGLEIQRSLPSHRQDAVAECAVPEESSYDTLLELLSLQEPNVYHIALRQNFCYNGTCDSYIPGTSTIWHTDHNHMSQAASLYIWPRLCNFFQSSGFFA